MALIWITDVFFPETRFEINGIMNLLYFSLIVVRVEIITSFVKNE